MKTKYAIHKLISLIFIFCIGLWTIDIGVSGIVTGNNVTTLVGIRSPADQYHIGLLICISSFLFLTFLTIKLLNIQEKNE